MAKYVTQYADLFFVLRNVQGYTGNMYFNGTKITDAEYKKLYYSSDNREQVNSISGKFMEIRIQGNANTILGREVQTVYPK